MTFLCGGLFRALLASVDKKMVPQGVGAPFVLCVLRSENTIGARNSVKWTLISKGEVAF